MGLDVQRFDTEVDEELICPICSCVLEDPVQAPQCEHCFCSACIHQWLNRQPSCPVDRQPTEASELRAAPRILRNLLARLTLACDNAAHGCPRHLKMDALLSHVEECEFNPRKPVQCEAGCGLVIPKDQMKEHNCVRELRAVVSAQDTRISELTVEMGEQRLLVTQLKQQMDVVKECLAAQNPRMRELQSQLENDEMTRWLETLHVARVTRWGGMISTPDAVLQAVIRRALQDSGCPGAVLDELMRNAHERHWPPGLGTLETRQRNRALYETYRSRRIPGKQAVLVLAAENSHLPDDLIVQPGIVMIFAHGVE